MDLVTWVVSGVITTRRPRGRALASVPLMDEEYVLVAGRRWGERVERHPAADDLCAALRDVPLVTYAEDLPIARRYWRTVFGKPLTARAALTVPNLHAVVAALTAASGYSVLPRSLCEDHLTTGTLTLLHAPEEPPFNTLFLVRRPGADTNPDVTRVGEVLRGAARDWQGREGSRRLERVHQRSAAPANWPGSRKSAGPGAAPLARP